MINECSTMILIDSEKNISIAYSGIREMETVFITEIVTNVIVFCSKYRDGEYNKHNQAILLAGCTC